MTELQARIDTAFEKHRLYGTADGEEAKELVSLIKEQQALLKRNINTWEAQYTQCLKDLQARDALIAELQKEIEELESRTVHDMESGI